MDGLVSLCIADKVLLEILSRFSLHTLAGLTSGILHYGCIMADTRESEKSLIFYWTDKCGRWDLCTYVRRTSYCFHCAVKIKKLLVFKLLIDKNLIA